MDCKKQLLNRIEMFREKPLNELNKNLILEHDREMETNSLAMSTRLNALIVLEELANDIKTPFRIDKKIEENRIEKVVFVEPKNMKDKIDEHIRKLGKRLSDSSLMRRKLTIKSFFRKAYAYDKGIYPSFVKHIKISTVEVDKGNKDIITWEDAYEMSKYADNARDACMPLFLLEVGCRVNEMQAMTRSSVKIINSQLAKITLKNSKVGLNRKFRTIEISKCVPTLIAWWNTMPSKDPDAVLWCGLSHNCKGEAVATSNVGKILKKLAERAKIDPNKPQHPHWYRHSSASIYSGFEYNEAMLRDRFAWRGSSKMPARYVEDSGESKKFREISGLKTKKEKTFIPPAPNTCKTCGNPILPIGGEIPEFCQRCGRRWDQEMDADKLAKELEETNRKMDLLVSIMIENMDDKTKEAVKSKFSKEYQERVKEKELKKS